MIHLGFTEGLSLIHVYWRGHCFLIGQQLHWIDIKPNSDIALFEYIDVACEISPIRWMQSAITEFPWNKSTNASISDARIGKWSKWMWHILNEQRARDNENNKENGKIVFKHFQLGKRNACYFDCIRDFCSRVTMHANYTIARNAMCQQSKRKSYMHGHNSNKKQ